MLAGCSKPFLPPPHTHTYLTLVSWHCFGGERVLPSNCSDAAAVSPKDIVSKFTLSFPSSLTRTTTAREGGAVIMKAYISFPCFSQAIIYTKDPLKQWFGWWIGECELVKLSFAGYSLHFWMLFLAIQAISPQSDKLGYTHSLLLAFIDVSSCVIQAHVFSPTIPNIYEHPDDWNMMIAVADLTAPHGLQSIPLFSPSLPRSQRAQRNFWQMLSSKVTCKTGTTVRQLGE